MRDAIGAIRDRHRGAIIGPKALGVLEGALAAAGLSLPA